jgi:hypothetical protein
MPFKVCPRIPSGVPLIERIQDNVMAGPVKGAYHIPHGIEYQRLFVTLTDRIQHPLDAHGFTSTRRTRQQKMLPFVALLNGNKTKLELPRLHLPPEMLLHDTLCAIQHLNTPQVLVLGE